MTSHAGKDVEQEKHFTFAGGNANLWQFLRKLRISLNKDPVIQLLSIYPQDIQFYHKGTSSTMFIKTLFIILRNYIHIPQSKNG